MRFVLFILLLSPASYSLTTDEVSSGWGRPLEETAPTCTGEEQRLKEQKWKQCVFELKDKYPDYNPEDLIEPFDCHITHRELQFGCLGLDPKELLDSFMVSDLERACGFVGKAFKEEGAHIKRRKKANALYPKYYHHCERNIMEQHRKLSDVGYGDSEDERKRKIELSKKDPFTINEIQCDETVFNNYFFNNRKKTQNRTGLSPKKNKGVPLFRQKYAQYRECRNTYLRNAQRDRQVSEERNIKIEKFKETVTKDCYFRIGGWGYFDDGILTKKHSTQYKHNKCLNEVELKTKCHNYKDYLPKPEKNLKKLFKDLPSKDELSCYNPEALTRRICDYFKASIEKLEETGKNIALVRMVTKKAKMIRKTAGKGLTGNASFKVFRRSSIYNKLNSRTRKFLTKLFSSLDTVEANKLSKALRGWNPNKETLARFALKDPALIMNGGNQNGKFKNAFKKLKPSTSELFYYGLRSEIASNLSLFPDKRRHTLKTYFLKKWGIPPTEEFVTEMMKAHERRPKYYGSYDERTSVAKRNDIFATYITGCKESFKKYAPEKKRPPCSSLQKKDMMPLYYNGLL